MFNLNTNYEGFGRDKILSLITEEEIFEHYLGIKPDYKNAFRNPLRGDTHAGCWFYVDSRGRIIFNDHSRKVSYDCFSIVQIQAKVDFSGALKIIVDDFNLRQGGNYTTGFINRNEEALKDRKRKEFKIIRIKRRDWNEEDDKIWNYYGFDRAYREKRHIYPISHAWWSKAGGNILELFYSYSKSDPCYAYHFGGYNYKLYFPLRSKGDKFRRASEEFIQGIDLIPEKGHILIINKSYKDDCVVGLFEQVFDIYSISSMSETQMIPEDIMLNRLIPNFDYIFTLFDFDRTGITTAIKYRERYGIQPLFFGPTYLQQGIKDIADYYGKHKYTKTKELMKYVYEQRINS